MRGRDCARSAETRILLLDLCRVIGSAGNMSASGGDDSVWANWQWVNVSAILP